jgi:Bacterial Ig-like domain
MTPLSKPQPTSFTLSACTLAASLFLAACGGGDAGSPPTRTTTSPPDVVIPDTTAPTVSITDDVDEDSASGPVTFTFSFSEDIGSSFSTDDIEVTGGTKGPFTLAGGRTAELVVTPTAGAASGTINVSVAAGAFSDAAGNASTAAASASQAYGTVTPPPAGLVLSFDEVPEAFSDLGSYGGALPSVEAGPAGGSGKALKIVKPTSPDTWGGAFFTLAAKVPFTTDKKSISARVRSSKAGAVYTFKVQVSETDFVEVASAPAGAADTWSTVTWDFSAVSLSKNYTVIAITPDVTAVTNGQSYYIDEITVVAGTAPPPPAGGSLLAGFDENPALEFLGFNGAEGSVIDTAPAGGGSGKAAKIVRAGGDNFAGAFVVTAANIPFSATRQTITAMVNSPKAGARFVMKVEGPAGAQSAEIAATPALKAGWQTLTFVFAGIDLGKQYNKIVILPELGTVAPTTGDTWWVDDIKLADAATAPPATSATLATFDETAALVVAGFGGAEGGTTVEAGPSGGNAKALKLVRSGGEVYAGAVVTTGKIGFTADRKTITARVHSSKAGVPILIKAEGAGGLQTPDAPATTAVVTGWQTLTWVLNADVSKTYDRITLLPDLGTVGTGQTYYFDDIKLLEAGAGPVVAAKTIVTLDEPGAVLVGFEGAWDSTIVNDPKGGTNKVGRVVKPGSGVPFYAGTSIVTVANGGLPKIGFTASAKTMTVRVWSPDAGIPVRLKVEDIADAAKSVETEATTSVAGGWQTLTFNFASPVSGTPALNLSNTYNKVSIFFNFGTVGSGKTYYFDDITFITGTGSNQVISTFDEAKPRLLTGFGGAEDSTVVGVSGGLPTGAVGKGVKVVKAAAEVWAGTSVQAKANDAVPTIPFVTGATKMTLRVLSAYPPGVRVHLKVEQAGNPEFNSEVDAFTTKTNEWETLTFDFGPDAIHAIPTGPGPTDYPLPHGAPGSTSLLDVTKTFNKVSVFFDFGLGIDGYDGMPDTRTYYFDQLRFIGK